MKIIYGKTSWEVPDTPIADTITRIAHEGFDAAELYIPGLEPSPTDLKSMIADNGLVFIGDVATEGSTVDEHIASLEKHMAYAIEAGSILINSHTGRDFFAFEDSARLFERSFEIAEAAGIPIAHETHRSRALYSAIDTRRFLEAIPKLRINADFSHWMNVHESDLSDQPDNVQLAINRAIHIHARVGHEEGPQVNDPRAPEWQTHLDNHIALWQRIADARRIDGSEVLTITPEFGPIPYMPTIPFTQEPIADTWEVNVWLRDTLRDRLK